MITGWNTSKINSWLVSLGCLLFQTPTSRIYSKGNAVIFWPEYGYGMEKSGFRHTKLKLLISLKWGKIRPRLLMRTNRKSHTSFLLVPRSTTLNFLEGHYVLCFKTCHDVVIYLCSFAFSLLLGSQCLQFFCSRCSS